MKKLLAVAVVAMSGTVFADVAEVQKPGGDLSADETWTDKDGNVVPHGADTDWEFKQSNSTGYTASDNITAVSLSWTKPTTIDLTGGPLRKVQLGMSGTAAETGNQYAIYPCCSRTVDVFPANSGELHIKGGSWDLGNWNLLAVKGWNRGANAQLWISDGAVMTNINQIQYAQKAAKNALRITGGSAVYVRKGNLKFNDAAATQTYFELSGGSLLSIGNEGGNANFGIFNETSWSTNLIAGAGTVFTNANNSAETVTAYHTLFHVDDGAKVYLNGPYFYYNPSSNNEIRVTRGAELYSRGTFYFSYQANAQNNRLFIGDGGILSATGVPFNGINNEICVSNGVWNAAASIFQDNAKGCTFRVMGESNTVKLINYMNGTGNRIVMDGAKFDMPDGLYMSTSDSCSNALEIVNGSVVTTPHVRFEVYAGASQGFRGARLLVAGRSEFKPSMINVTCADNSIIIDDATIRTMTDNNIALMLATPAKGPTEGNRLVLKGRQPLFDATNGATVYFRSNSVVRVEIPTNGFENAEQALIRAKNWSSDGTTHFEFAGLEEHRQTLERPVTYTLFDYVDRAYDWYDPFGTAAEWEALQAAVAPFTRCRVFRDDGKVKLRVAPDLGGMILVR